MPFLFLIPILLSLLSCLNQLSENADQLRHSHRPHLG
jgi:hypothetical protein